MARAAAKIDHTFVADVASKRKRASKRQPEPEPEVPEAVVVREYFNDQANNLPKVHICVDCGEPLRIGEIPLVLSWEKKDPRLPSHLGREPKEVLHINCDRARRGLGPQGTVVDIATGRTTPTADKSASKASAPSSPRAASAKKVLDGQRIFKLGKWKSSNPRKEGTHGWASFNLVKDGMTVAEYLKAGGRRNDLQWDVDHGYVRVGEGSEEAPETTQEPKAADVPSKGADKAPGKHLDQPRKPVTASKPTRKAPPPKPEKKAPKKGALVKRKRG